MSFNLDHKPSNESQYGLGKDHWLHEFICYSTRSVKNKTSNYNYERTVKKVRSQFKSHVKKVVIGNHDNRVNLLEREEVFSLDDVRIFSA